MRFYRIIPGVPEQRHLTHWLLGGSERWTHLTTYASACGENIFGRVVMSFAAETVTCERCLIELLAQVLKDQARVDDEVEIWKGE